MKKIIPIFLALVLAVSVMACSPKVPEISKETMFFQNTEWGMSKADTLKALKLKEKDLTLVEQGREAVDFYKVENYKYNDNMSDLFLVFYNDKPNNNWASSDSLCNAIVNFKSDVDMQAEIDKYIGIFGEPKELSRTTVDGSAELFIFLSKNTPVDYLKDNNIPIDEYFDAKVSNRSLSTEEKENEMRKSPLAEVTIKKYIVANKDGYVGSIDFDGSVYASVATFNKK